MAETEDLTQLHLADLHAKAAEVGVNGYRMLGRDELIAEIQAGGKKKRSRWPRRKASKVDPETKTDELKVLDDKPEASAGDDAPAGDAPAERKPAARRRGNRGGRGRGGGGRNREKLGGDNRDERGPPPENEETEEITGTLEITRQRHGFLSVEGSDDDVYVSASQVRRCEMKEGDEVTGPVRAPRRGERHRALVRVNLVNGEPPVDAPTPKKKGGGGGGGAAKADPFDSLTPAPPSRRIELPADASGLVRAADLLAPLAFGQRVLVKAAPRAGRTTLLRDLAQALASVDGVELTVLLIDERPEEAPAWTEAVPSADLALAPADLSPSEQVKVARTAVERARKQASKGADAVLLCDSLSRLAVAAKGVDDVKRLFGSGRALAEEDAGTLTVVATTLGDEGEALEAVTTTETSLITLDPTLAAEGISPALVFGECRAVGDDKILSEEEMQGLRRLRSELSEVVAPEGAGIVRRHLESASSNADVLKSLS
ncbi:MAG: transcription termination factor Rho [Solirubrobacterales bacterium]|jgi:transcription termination factor Rho|nr:transcription termination factor Rho [Solirubrobacterales bacterium]